MMDFLVVQTVKNLPAMQEIQVRSGRSPGQGNDYPLQYSCLKNSMDRGAWWVTIQEVTKSQTRLSDTFTFTNIIQCLNVSRILFISFVIWYRPDLGKK